MNDIPFASSAVKKGKCPVAVKQALCLTGMDAEYAFITAQIQTRYYTNYPGDTKK